MRIPYHILVQLRLMNGVATPGPWVASRGELFCGHITPGVPHHHFANADDAALIAVMRTWLPEIIADLEGLPT